MKSLSRADRSIPAWAGEPPPGDSRMGRLRVYPRVGGGAASEVLTISPDYGLSPRGRGSHSRPAAGRQGLGSIPAWAGEPGVRGRRPDLAAVYPRVGGGATTQRARNCHSEGLSPRGRGSHLSFPLGLFWFRSIPAWAGEPGEDHAGPSGAQVYPRVGGGASRKPWRGLEKKGLSPRGRGSRIDVEFDRVRNGSIPAWAGEPAERLQRDPPGRVYPRVGGGAGFHGCGCGC